MTSAAIFDLRRSVFRTKNQRGGSFSCLNALKNKSLTLPGHFDRFKMVHVQLTKSRNWRNYQIRLDFDWENHVWIALSLYEHPRRPSTSETLTIFGLWSSKLEKLFLTGVFGRHFEKPAWWKFIFSCLSALKNKSWIQDWIRFKMVHVDSQIKEFLKFKSKILPKVSSKPI